MSSSYSKPEEIMDITVQNGVKKTGYSIKTSLILGFQAGAFIALGYLLSIRITAPLTGDRAGIGTFLGEAVFPIGLILTLIAGGELLTGNMMAVPLAAFARKISVGAVLRNWMIITLSNFIGALFVAYAFGHIAGLTSSGIFLEKTVGIAGHKLEATFLEAFVSGIGCNWLLAAAVWLSYGAKDINGKIAGIWFPTMTFVAIGFQHVVANMFVIPAAFYMEPIRSQFCSCFFGECCGRCGVYRDGLLVSLPQTETEAQFPCRSFKIKSLIEKPLAYMC